MGKLKVAALVGVGSGKTARFAEGSVDPKIS
jgi:hypothetical protein